MPSEKHSPRPCEIRGDIYYQKAIWHAWVRRLTACDTWALVEMPDETMQMFCVADYKIKFITPLEHS